MINKNVLIIESCEKKISSDYSNTSIVHVRNSLIIAEILNADLITHFEQIEEYKDNKYDVIIVMYASHYMKWKQYIKLLENNRKAELFWLVNDHDLEDNILLRQAVIILNKTYNMICNNPREGYRHWILGKKVLGKKLNDFIIKWHTLNLNVLIFTPQKREFNQNQLFKLYKKGLIYYGTFRKHRMKEMLDYSGIGCIISTSKRNQPKYEKAGINATFVDRLGWTKGNEHLFNYKYSLYLEDQHTHKNYAYMANRYYECLMCDVLMFFDFRCSNTINKSGYNIPDFLIVENGEELSEKMRTIDGSSALYSGLLEIQRNNFEKIIKERKEVATKIRAIVESVKQSKDKNV